MISAIERTYDEVRMKRQTRNEMLEASIQELTKFCGLSKWHAEKYGQKYADMDFAEEVMAEEERAKELKEQPLLFDFH
jgi:hypothetical protein